MEKQELSRIERLFEMFSGAAMNPRKYAKKNLPATVTIALDPAEMEMLHVISSRIGAPRSNVAHHILKIGLAEAAWGCGFTTDEEGNIPEEEKGKWDVTPRVMGISHTGPEDKE